VLNGEILFASLQLVKPSGVSDLLTCKSLYKVYCSAYFKVFIIIFYSSE
jgi:hypothetical protein